MVPEAIEIKQTANEYLVRLTQGVLDVAFDARFTLGFNSVDSLKDMYEGIGWLIEAFKLISPYCNSKPKVNEEFIFKTLDEITQALQRKDFVYLADLLEYEIHPILSEWLEVVV